MRNSTEPAILLRVDDVCAMTGLGRSKVYELLETGEIPSLQIGRSRRVRRQDLIDWMGNLFERQHPMSAGLFVFPSAGASKLQVGLGLGLDFRRQWRRTTPAPGRSRHGEREVSHLGKTW